MKDCAVVKPHGPDSQIPPSGSTTCSGSPSVRCASTTVAGANVAFHVAYVGIGVPVVGSFCDGGGVIAIGAATGTSEKRPLYGYGPPAGSNGVDGFGDLQTCTV